MRSTCRMVPSVSMSGPQDKLLYLLVQPTLRSGVSITKKRYMLNTMTINEVKGVLYLEVLLNKLL